MITYTDQAVLVDKLRQFFSDLPLVMQAADIIEELFTEVEGLRTEVDEQDQMLAAYEDQIYDIKRALGC